MAKTYKFGNGTWARKKGSTLAYSDTNNAFKPLPFSFERDSIATRVNKEGLIEVVGNDIPRIDYTDSTEGALLLENSATNLVTYSEDFSNAAWLKGGATIVGGFTSPSINNNAYKLIENSSNSTHYIGMVGQALNSSYSVFAKKGEKKWVLLTSHWSSGSDFRGQFFDLENGIVGSGGDANGKIEDYGNGWYRCSIEANSSPSSLFTVMLAESDGVESYQGNGTDGVYIWGAQNTDTNLSSYIPTNGSTVQRSAETANGSGNSEVFNDSEGVLFADISALDESGGFRDIRSDSTFNNEIEFAYYGTNQWNFILRVSGGTPNVIGTVNASGFSKFSVSYTTTDFKVYLNGFLIGSNTLPSSLSGLKVLNFNLPNNNNPFYGNTKEIGYYDTLLTDAELEYMTSYRSLNEMVTELNLNAL